MAPAPAPLPRRRRAARRGSGALAAALVGGALAVAPAPAQAAPPTDAAPPSAAFWPRFTGALWYGDTVRVIFVETGVRGGRWTSVAATVRGTSRTRCLGAGTQIEATATGSARAVTHHRVLRGDRVVGVARLRLATRTVGLNAPCVARTTRTLHVTLHDLRTGATASFAGRAA